MTLISIMQTASDLKEVISTNDATIQGILIAIVLALGAAVIYLYNQVRNLQKEYVEQLIKNNEMLVKVNNQYNEYINIIDRNLKNRD